QSYDSVDAVGYGFPHSPYIDPTNTAVSANGANGSRATGAYVYNVTAERKSAAGVLQRSPFGIAISKNIPGPNGSANVAIAPAALGRPLRMRGHKPLYRSEANG